MANIYQRKQLWKKILLAFAVVIVLASFWYTRQLVDNIAAEERNSVKIWAEALKKKARLVHFTAQLFQDLRAEERKKVELWVEANKRLTSDDPNVDLNFLTKILTDNTTVPVIWADGQKTVKAYRNLARDSAISPEYLNSEIARMEKKYEPIPITYLSSPTDYLYYDDSRIFTELQHTFSDLEQSFISEVVSNSASVPVIITDSTQTQIIAWGNMDSSSMKNRAFHSIIIAEMLDANEPIEISLQEGVTNYIFYQDSAILKQLKYYPFVQFGVIGLFILIGYVLFSTARRAEQNQVWVGMAKETAHQLGTPLSSLMGWVEYIKSKDIDPIIATELSKDINRLETITERFSKIGSLPELKPENIETALQPIVDYMKSRSPKKVEFITDYPPGDVKAKLNVPLFNWVVENLVRNAVDAMAGKGKISFVIRVTEREVLVDVSDTGKGIATSKKKDVFEPGFTTKTRGWGLGLALSKRIIEDYHKGRIFVKSTKPNEGTTFRIVLSKA
jgi:signal transduction histidine kinase